jgi:hypothetical protein
MKNPRRALIRSSAVLLLFVFMTGCASSAPPVRLTELTPLVGKWSGTVTVGPQFEQFFYLTINADQTLVAISGSTTSWGTVKLANGQASFEMSPPPREGTFRLYQGRGKPTLYMENLTGAFYAVVTRQE